MKRYAVIGMGQFGRHLAVTLHQLGAQVLVLDSSEASLEVVKDQVDQAAVLDATNETSLAASGVLDMDCVVVAIGEDLSASVLVTALLIKMHVPRVIARASSELHESILKSIGAHRTINPEREYAFNVAHEIENPSRRQAVRLSTGHRVVDIVAGQSIWGKTLQELDFRRRFSLNVIAIRRTLNVLGKHGESIQHEELNDLPAGNDQIRQGDVLVVLGSDKNLARFEEEMN